VDDRASRRCANVRPYFPYTQAAGERDLGNHALVSLELCTLPIRLRANLQLPLRIPQISVRSLGVIYPIAIGYWESCWPDAMFDTRFFTMIEHLYLIFSRLAYSADVRANALRRVLK